jgi:hypothetical protein
LEEETEESFVGFAAFSLENVQNARRRHRDKTNPQNEFNLALHYWNFATTINTVYSANITLAFVLKLEIISAST